MWRKKVMQAQLTCKAWLLSSVLASRAVVADDPAATCSFDVTMSASASTIAYKERVGE
jgi:hypothetical protein